MAAFRPGSAAYLLLVLTDVALASATCPGGWARFDEDGKCYKVTAGRFNSLGCTAACGENATLACIRSSAEADFIASLTRSVGDVWIGLYQLPGAVEPGGGWDTCASGVTTNFTNWQMGYPSNFYRTTIFRDLAEMAYASRQCAAKRRVHLRNGWFDSPCYLRYRCLCELGAPASAEYLAFMEADIAKGQQLLRTLTAILYGGLIPAAWLVPLTFYCALLACLRLRRKFVRSIAPLPPAQIVPCVDADASFKGGSESCALSAAFQGSALSSARNVVIPQTTRRRSFRENPNLTEKKLRQQLTDAVAKANRLRLRVSFTLAQLGWMLVVLTVVPALFGNFIDVDLTPIASNIESYYFAFLPGVAVILLALRPTYAKPIRIVGVLGVFCSAAALYAALVPLLSFESSSSIDGLSVFALNIIRSSGLALIAAVACVLFSHTFSVRFVCRRPDQFKPLAEAIALKAPENATKREEAAKEAKKYLKLLERNAQLSKLPPAQQPQQAIDLCKEYLQKRHTGAAALKELAAQIKAGQIKAEQIEADQQIEAGQFKAIQSAAKKATVAIQSNSFIIRLLTMPPLNLWFAFRLAFIPGRVIYCHNWKTNETSWWKKSDEITALEAAQERAVVAAQSAWMEFTLEYTTGARGQLLCLWLTLRVVCIGVALLYLAIFLSMMLLGPSVDPYGADPAEAGAIENVILSAIALAVALVFTPANRGRFVAWLGALGKSDKSESAALSEATALASLLGNISPAKALTMGIRHFRALPLDKLTEEEIAGRKAGTVAGDWKTSPGWPTWELCNKTSQAKFGQVDAFISHSWSDDGVAKFKCLHEWKKDELDKHKDKTAVTIWLDKACLDQRDMQASLAVIPIFIAGCKQLLVLAGETYASRLWCVIDLFVFVQVKPKEEWQDRMRVMSLTSEVHDGLKNFDAGKAETFDPNDRERLLALIEASFGTLEPFNQIVRNVYKRTLTKRAIGKLSIPEQAKLLKKMEPDRAKLTRIPAEIADHLEA